MKSYKCITANGQQVRLHRVIMEAHVGRKLMSWELVHHKDGDKHNNELSNLSITNRSIHMKTHKIGERSRFKAKYIIKKEDLVELYVNQKLPIWRVAEKIKATYGSVFRALKKHSIKRNIICCICGKKARYIKRELCNKCYQADYHVTHRRN